MLFTFFYSFQNSLIKMCINNKRRKKENNRGGEWRWYQQAEEISLSKAFLCSEINLDLSNWSPDLKGPLLVGWAGRPSFFPK